MWWRFLKFWLLDYATATLVSFGVVNVIILLTESTRFLDFAFVFLPLNALWVTFLFFRGRAIELSHRWIIAVVWLVLDVLADYAYLKFFSSIRSPALQLAQFAPLLAYGAKFFAIILAAHLAVRAGAVSETPSPRSELASQLSSVRRPRGLG